MRLSRNLFVKIALLVLSVFFFVSFVSLQLQNNSLQERADQLNYKIEEYKLYIENLQATLDAPMDEKYISEIAREELGLRYPQEVVFYSGDSE